MRKPTSNGVNHRNAGPNSIPEPSNPGRSDDIYHSCLHCFYDPVIESTPKGLDKRGIHLKSHVGHDDARRPQEIQHSVVPGPDEQLNLWPMAIEGWSKALLEDCGNARVLLHDVRNFFNARCS
jgi:hypothetical protein